MSRFFLCMLICVVECGITATAGAQSVIPVGMPDGIATESGTSYIGEFDPYGNPQGPGNGSWATPGGPWAAPHGQPPPEITVPNPFIVNRYFRTEWMNLSIERPGQVMLGAPVAGVSDLSLPFQAVDELSGSVFLVTIPNLSSVELTDTTGVRFTVGLDYEDGHTIEVGAFVTENSVRRFSATDLTDDNQFATSVLINGQVSDGSDAFNLLFYNDSYQFSYGSRVWGTDVNYLGDRCHVSEFEIRPLAGFRYVGLYEELFQRGRFVDRDDFSEQFGLVIDSELDHKTINTIYGPQIGFRLDLATKYLTFGVEPKFGMAINNALAKVRTNRLRSETDGVVATTDSTMVGCTIFDIGSYVRWNATDNFTLSFGYSFLYLGSVLRAADNTFYDDTGDLTQPPGVVAVAHKRDILVRGITLGGEFRW